MKYWKVLENLKSFLKSIKSLKIIKSMEIVEKYLNIEIYWKVLKVIENSEKFWKQ